MSNKKKYQYRIDGNGIFLPYRVQYKMPWFSFWITIGEYMDTEAAEYAARRHARKRFEAVSEPFKTIELGELP